LSFAPLLFEPLEQLVRLPWLSEELRFQSWRGSTADSFRSQKGGQNLFYLPAPGWYPTWTSETPGASNWGDFGTNLCSDSASLLATRRRLKCWGLRYPGRLRIRKVNSTKGFVALVLGARKTK
jgi:hypothetical protein